MTIRPQLSKKDASQAPQEVDPEQQPEESPSRETSSPQGQKRRHKTSPHRHRKRTSFASPQSAAMCQPGPSEASSAPLPLPALSPLENVAPGPSENENSAYNSGDEYDRQDRDLLSERELAEKEKCFEKILKQKKGFVIKKMNEDGACLFRAVADQIYGDQEMHDLIRQNCMDYITKNADYFSQYMTEPFDSYIARKRRAHAHGNHLEMHALSEMFNRPIEIYCYSDEPINIFDHKSSLDPIRLSYHRGIHYNSIIDPYKPTIGVGLGLPGYQPGAADKNQLVDAFRASEQTELERQMLKDKLLASDYEATNEALEQQVAHESYLEFLRENERRNRKRQRGTTSSQGGDSPKGSSSPRSGRVSPKVGCSTQGGSSQTSAKTSPRNSPRLSTVREDPSCSSRYSPKPCTSKDFQSPAEPTGGASFVGDFPLEMFGLEDYDDGVLARVLAESQEEYFRHLKKQSHDNNREPAAGCSKEQQQGASTSKQETSVQYSTE